MKFRFTGGNGEYNVATEDGTHIGIVMAHTRYTNGNDRVAYWMRKSNYHSGWAGKYKTRAEAAEMLYEHWIRQPK